MAEGNQGGQKSALNFDDKDNQNSTSSVDDEVTMAGAEGNAKVRGGGDGLGHDQEEVPKVDNPDNKSAAAGVADFLGRADAEDEDVKIWCNPKWRMNLLKSRHIDFCRRLLFKSLPNHFEEYDTQRVNFLHFAVASLDLLQAMDTLTPEERDRIVNWVYRLQITSGPPEKWGFQGSSTCIIKPNPAAAAEIVDHFMSYSHVTMTFAALVTLLTLGDDLRRVNRTNVLKGVQALQNADGSFKASLGCTESDMRFVYSAVAICYILNDFSVIDIPLLVNYISGSLAFDGSFGSGCGGEGHAAYTFCAVASLFLMNKLSDTLSENQLKSLQRWCIFRQTRGFTGRPNKDEDTCYSFWVGATLEILQSLPLAGREENIDWILSNQNPLTGGIGKCDNDFTDPLHTFMGIAGLSLVNYDDLNPIHPALTMSQNTVGYLHRLHDVWAQES